jgi:hypothetical protein
LLPILDVNEFDDGEVLDADNIIDELNVEGGATAVGLVGKVGTNDNRGPDKRQ